MSQGPQRVLIVSASIGAGHVAAGRALEAAFADVGTETLHVDLLDYTSAPFRRLYRQAYFDLVRSAPDFIDWLGKRLDRPPARVRARNLRLRARLVRLISYYLPRTISGFKPDLLVSTHFLASEILSTTRRTAVPPQAVVVTDFAAHRMWLQPHVTRYYVASDEVRAHLLALGLAKPYVRVSGIPIDLRFSVPHEKSRAREQLGYPVDRDLLLVMAGGMSAPTVEAILLGLKELRMHLHVVVVCGRSPELLQRSRAMAEGESGPVSLEVRGFSDDVPQLMSAADLLVGKPGGLTTSEALASGLPFAVVDPYPLQEEANANFLLEHGAGMRIEPLSTLNLKLARFFKDPRRRTVMSNAARELGRPGAAREIVNDLLRDPPVLPRGSR